MRLPGADSIRGRLIWFGSAWLVVALIAAWLVIGAVLGRFITQRFDAEIAATSAALIAATEADARGLAQLTRTPEDPRFLQPLSGWFWQIAADGEVFARSASLYDSTLSGDVAPDGRELRVLRRDYTVPGSDEALQVTVTAPQAEITAALADVRRPLALSLLILGLGLAVAVLLQVTAGLGALRGMRAGINAIRNGKAARLEAAEVRELAPVTQEINALIDANHAQLTRTRDQIGNLAHSLKTPLMALANGLPADDPGHALIAQMDRQIGWHLKRARSAAAPAALGQQSEIAPVLNDILVVLRRMLTDRGVEVATDIPPGATMQAEAQDAQEMIGNLMENAAKWARAQIRVSARREGAVMRIAIADDGPGMDEADHARALSRGARLDERGPGAGLGLAIVADLAGLHGGALRLSRDAELGGLRATLELPA
ncbi:MAG: sensor histidine kinase [Paracoccus sp. (in: a-proteobacteria)]|nr:sensor histidine kinase [Paracoccus sp. (in: a-proteobacteria)]